MKNKLVIIVLISVHVFAEPPFTWINELHAVTDDAHVSVLSGIVAWEMGVVEAMYRRKDASNPTIKCIQEMFYLQPDDVSFKPTVHENKFSTYCTASTIGNLVVALADYRTMNPNERDKQKLHARLYDTIALEIQRVKSVCIETNRAVDQKLHLLDTEIGQLANEKSNLEKKHANASKKMRMLKKKAAQQLLTSDEYVQLDELACKQARVKDIAINTQLINQKKVALRTEDYKEIMRTIRLLDQTVTKNITQNVTNFVAAAELENSGMYQHGCADTCSLEQVLTAWLWARSTSRQDGIHVKQDLIDYYSAMPHYSNNNALAAWIVARPYTQNDYEDFMHELSQQPSDCVGSFMSKNYEKAVFARIAHRTWQQFFPPILIGIQTTYYHPTKKTHLAANCVETALRNLCNIIAYNKTKSAKMFDSAYLSSMKGLNPYIKNFYDTNSALEAMRAQHLHADWAIFLMDVPGIAYIHPDDKQEHERFYEVQSSVPNIMRCINYLFFGNDPEYAALPRLEQLNLLCSTMSRDGFQISWRSCDDISIATFGTIEFLINATGALLDGEHRFVLNILHEHCFIPPHKEDNPYLYATNSILIE